MNEEDGPPKVPPNHLYSVAVRFYGADLDPAEISRKLDIEASQTMSKAEAEAEAASLKRPRRPRRPRRPFWGYSGHDLPGYQLEWESFEVGLLFVAKRLVPVRAQIVELSKVYSGIWWCGHFQTSFDGGPTLHPTTLTEIASFELPLYIDNYFSFKEE